MGTNSLQTSLRARCLAVVAAFAVCLSVALVQASRARPASALTTYYNDSSSTSPPTTSGSPGGSGSYARYRYDSPSTAPPTTTALASSGSSRTNTHDDPPMAQSPPTTMTSIPVTVPATVPPTTVLPDYGALAQKPLSDTGLPQPGGAAATVASTSGADTGTRALTVGETGTADSPPTTLVASSTGSDTGGPSREPVRRVHRVTWQKWLPLPVAALLGFVVLIVRRPTRLNRFATRVVATSLVGAGVAGVLGFQGAVVHAETICAPGQDQNATITIDPHFSAPQNGKVAVEVTGNGWCPGHVLTIYPEGRAIVNDDGSFVGASLWDPVLVGEICGGTSAANPTAQGLVQVTVVDSETGTNATVSGHPICMIGIDGSGASDESQACADQWRHTRFDPLSPGTWLGSWIANDGYAAEGCNIVTPTPPNNGTVPGVIGATITPIS